MPIYIYQHPKTNETREIVQRMSEPHVYVDEKGVAWNRVLVNPQITFDSQISPHSSEDFKKKTRGKNYTVGDMWDISAELSEKRGGNSGVDEIKVKAEEAYRQKTGKSHPHSKKKTRMTF